MNIHLAGANVVISAKQFNPSVFSQLWLVRNQLVSEDDFGPGYLYSEAVVQMVTPQFQMLVLPNQLQFTPIEYPDGQQALIEEKVGRIVEHLPHTPYLAVGLNFVWHLHSEQSSIEQQSRAFFFKSDSDLYRRFDVEDASFGAYLSRSFLGGRLKLDIKPISLDTAKHDEMQCLQFAFNFHRDLGDEEEPFRQIQETLHRWDEIREEARQIVESLNNERTG